MILLRFLDIDWWCLTAIVATRGRLVDRTHDWIMFVASAGIDGALGKCTPAVCTTRKVHILRMGFVLKTSRTRWDGIVARWWCRRTEEVFLLRMEPGLSPLPWHVLFRKSVDDNDADGVDNSANPGEEEEQQQVQSKVHTAPGDAGNGARGNYEPHSS